jgi:hypothetical protein
MNALLLVALFGGWDINLPIPNNGDQSSSVTIDGEMITLRNRGTLVSKQEYPNGAVVSATWRWTQGRVEGKYHDCLTIGVFTSGKQPQWSFEVDDGIVVGFNPAGESISVHRMRRDPERLAITKMRFEKDRDYRIVVEATLATLTVLVDGKKMVSCGLPRDRGGKRIAVYNREPVAAVVKESVLTQLKILPPLQ